MAKIYFRRQATVPPTGTNGIATFCTSNQTFYLDGIPYGDGGAGSCKLSALTMETWWSGISDIPIVDGTANIDLTDFANQKDVKRLLDDVFVIKNELELSGPLSGDPRSAIDILNEDVTVINKDLQQTKGVVSANTEDIKNNYKAITRIDGDLTVISANTTTNSKNIAVADQRIGKLEDWSKDTQYTIENMQTYEQEMKNMIIDIDDTYVSAITFNGGQKFIPKNKVVNITAKTYDYEIEQLEAGVSVLNQNLSSVSGELSEFEDEVAADMDNIYETMISAVSVNGINVPSASGIAKLQEVKLGLSGRLLSVSGINSGVSSVELPMDNVITGGTYDTETKEFIFYAADGSSFRVDASHLVDTYYGDGSTIDVSGHTISVASAVTSQIDANTEDIINLYDTVEAISGAASSSAASLDQRISSNSSAITELLSSVGILSGDVDYLSADSQYQQGEINNIVSAVADDEVVLFKIDGEYISGVSLNDEMANVSGHVAYLSMPKIDLSDTISAITISSGLSASVSTSDRKSDITLVPASLAYNKTAGQLMLIDEFGTSGDVIELVKDRFVQSATFDPSTYNITLIFNDSASPITINVSGLVDTYSGDGITIDVENNTIALTSTYKTKINNAVRSISFNGNIASANTRNGRLNLNSILTLKELNVDHNDMYVLSGSEEDTRHNLGLNGGSVGQVLGISSGAVKSSLLTFYAPYTTTTSSVVVDTTSAVTQAVVDQLKTYMDSIHFTPVSKAEYDEFAENYPTYWDSYVNKYAEFNTVSAAQMYSGFVIDSEAMYEQINDFVDMNINVGSLVFPANGHTAPSAVAGVLYDWITPEANKVLEIESASQAVLNAEETSESHILGLKGGSNGQALVAEGGSLDYDTWAVTYFDGGAIGDNYYEGSFYITGYNLSWNNIQEMIPSLSGVSPTYQSGPTSGTFQVSSTEHTTAYFAYFGFSGTSANCAAVISEIGTYNSAGTVDRTAWYSNVRDKDSQFCLLYPVVYLSNQTAMVAQRQNAIHYYGLYYIKNDEIVGWYEPNTIATKLKFNIYGNYFPYISKQTGETEWDCQPDFSNAPCNGGYVPCKNLTYDASNHVDGTYDGYVNEGYLNGYGYIYSEQGQTYKWSDIYLTSTQVESLKAIFSDEEEEDEEEVVKVIPEKELE